MNNLLAIITAVLTCNACINWNDAQLVAAGQQPDPMVLTAISGVLNNVSSMNAAASYLGGNPAVIKIKQCGDALKLTRDVVPWPQDWAVVQNPDKPNYPGMVNCYITDGTQYVPMVVLTTF